MIPIFIFRNKIYSLLSQKCLFENCMDFFNNANKKQILNNYDRVEKIRITRIKLNNLGKVNEVSLTLFLLYIIHNISLEELIQLFLFNLLIFWHNLPPAPWSIG